MSWILRMMGAEWRKIRGRGLAYAVLLFGFLHGAAAAAVMYGGVKLNEKVTEQPLDAADWLMPTDMAVTFGAFYANLLVLMVLYAVLWAEDHSLGTAAMILVRPVRRVQVFAGKLLTSLAVAAASIGGAMLLGALLGLVLFGVSGDVSEIPAGSPLLGWMSEVPTMGARALRVAAGWPAATLLMFPVIGLSALFAALTRSPLLTLAGTLLAVAADFGFAAMLWFWGNLDLETSEAAKTVREWTLFASRDYLGHHGTATIFADGGADLARTVGYSLVFLALALLIEVKRDVS